MGESYVSKSWKDNMLTKGMVVWPKEEIVTEGVESAWWYNVMISVDVNSGWMFLVGD